MPSWMATYLAIYIAFSLWAFTSDLLKGKLTRTFIIEFIGCTCLVVSSMAYWNFSVRRFFGETLAWLLFIGLLMLIFFLCGAC
jgi:hypothetical protein